MAEKISEFRRLSQVIASPAWSSFDRIAAALIVPLAFWIILSGFDDLIVDIAAAMAWLRRRLLTPVLRRDLLRKPQQRIAILVPCWQESSVIASMVSANRDRIQYANYEIFVGAYPNDEETLDVLRQLESQFSNVHLALCPHAGPTSKADCLNWIYQTMLRVEQSADSRFDIIVTHDAEDVIHPDALHWINWYSGEYDMVQVPVLPLPTPMTKWTHGVYCDEFTEYQYRDMPARQFMGAFVPSNGVGTGFRREALDTLAADEGNRIFEPVCLTEDYENGLRLKLRGARQIFVSAAGRDIATREYFPADFSSAVKQRTRWITGIALQTWERHGWGGSLTNKYWLWRDRKGLIGNPTSFLTNVLFATGLVTGPLAWLTHSEWITGRVLAGFAPLFALTSAVGLYRVLYRSVCTAHNFGWRFALGVPVRIVVANCINSLATWRAVSRYIRCRMQGEPLRWVKTEHQYPGAEALTRHRRLGEVLVAHGYLSDAQLRHALATQPANRRVGEHLVSLGYITEDELYDALCLQAQLPHSRVGHHEVRPVIARSLPAHVTRHHRVLPFRVENGALLVASSELPDSYLRENLQRFTSLEIRIHLMTPTRLRALTEQLL